MIVALALEINYLSGNYEDKRHLEYNGVQYAGFVFSIITLTFGVVIQTVIIVIAIIKRNNKKSRIIKVLNGLNPKRKLFPILYFAHFYLTRILIVIFIFITPYMKTDSKYLIVLFAVYQFCAIIAHALFIYEKWTERILALLREVQIFAIVIYLSVI